MSIIHDALRKLEYERATPGPQGDQKQTAFPSFPAVSPDLPSNYPQTTNKSISERFFGIFSRKNLTGLDIGSTSIKFVKLSEEGKSYLLVDAGYVKLGHEAGEDETIDGLKRLLRQYGIRNEKVSSLLVSKSMIFTEMILPAMPDADLKEAVRWEIKKVMDSQEDTVIDYIINNETVEDGKKKLSILAFAVRRDEVLHHVKLLKDASLIPAALDVGPMALLSAFDYNYGWEKEKRYAILDIGASKTTLSILSSGSVRFIRFIPLAGNDITRSIQDEEHIDFQAAEDKKVQYASSPDEAQSSVQKAIASFIEGMTMEVRRSFIYYKAQKREGEIDGVLISGGCAKIKGIDRLIGDSIGIPTAVYDITRGVAVSKELLDSAKLPDLSPLLVEAFGLALRREGE
ncbi:MAG: type IV pilus assembly protein PilM [Deltaproteobacteria bacterium]|nr:type IV pilus assembly protein PilM [Deltaproteobacteria bacterium]